MLLFVSDSSALESFVDKMLEVLQLLQSTKKRDEVSNSSA